MDKLIKEIEQTIKDNLAEIKAMRGDNDEQSNCERERLRGEIQGCRYCLILIQKHLA